MALKYLLLIKVFFLSFSSSLFGGLSEEIQRAVHITVTELGQLMSLSQVGSLLSFLTLPLISRYLGAHSMLVVGIFGSAIALVGMGLSHSFLLFGIFFLCNALTSYLYITSNTLLLVASEPEQMRRNIPLMHLIYSVGAIVSGFYITFLKEHTWYHGYLQIGALYLVLGALLALQRPPAALAEYHKQPKQLRDSFSLLRGKQFLRYLFFLVIANSIEYTNVVYPLIALTQLHGAGAKEIGLAISILHVGATLSRVLVIPLLKRGTEAKPVLISLALISIAAQLLFFFAPHLLPAYLAIFLMGIGQGGVNPVSQVLEIAQWPDELLQLANVRAMGSTIGRMVIPLLLSALVAPFGLTVIFPFLALLLGVGTLVLMTFRTTPSC